ncbi:MAG: hypothetical protein GY714_00035 [Desulfobacterales bacterium]|nr:hypothetical protein [Desulfobacterales bacterium]
MECILFFQSLDLNEEELAKRQVEHLDIANDELPEKYYNKDEVSISNTHRAF